MLESGWHAADRRVSLNNISAQMFFVTTCLGGMLGFEAVWIDPGGLRQDLEYIENTRDEHGVGWPIVGRFKGEGDTTGTHVFPIAATMISGLRFLEVMRHFVARLAELGHNSSWAFHRADGSRAADYRRLIFTKLEDIQCITELIKYGIDIWETYNVQRSG